MGTCIAHRNHEDQGKLIKKFYIMVYSWEKGGIPFERSAHGFACIWNLYIGLIGGFVGTSSVFL